MGVDKCAVVWQVAQAASSANGTQAKAVCKLALQLVELDSWLTALCAADDKVKFGLGQMTCYGKGEGPVDLALILLQHCSDPYEQILGPISAWHPSFLRELAAVDGVEDILVGLDDAGRKTLEDSRSSSAAPGLRKVFSAAVPKERQDMKAVNDGIKFGTGC